MKKILIIGGAGFSEQDDIRTFLENRGDRVAVGSVHQPEILADFETADTILLRGTWSAGIEERLLSSSIAHKLEPGFAAIAKRQAAGRPPVVIGVGRGALVLMASKNLGFCDFSSLEWAPANVNVGPWIEVQAADSKREAFPALVQGRAFPVIRPEKLSKSVSTWIHPKGQSKDTPVGLKVGKKMFLSFLDILAFGERTQLPDYGYRELHSMPTQDKILFSLMDGEL